MGTSNKLLAGLNKLFDRAGKQIEVRYYNQTIGSIYDEADSLTISGSVWTSGIVFPLGNSDSVLLEQGKIAENDLKLYTIGSLVFSNPSGLGSVLQVKIGVGSPISNYYSIIPINQMWEVENTPVYKMMYIRKLTTGSLIGE